MWVLGTLFPVKPEPLTGWAHAQGPMGSLGIVVPEPSRQRLATQRRGPVGFPVSPLSGQGLDETFRLSVGTWHVRSCLEMAQIELTAEIPPRPRVVCGAVVGHDSLGFDTLSLKPADSTQEESAAGFLALIP